MAVTFADTQRVLPSQPINDAGFIRIAGVYCGVGGLAHV